jgi:uncharacterized membrane protein
MKLGAITLFVCGIFLLGLSGLEKVLIYLAGAVSFKTIQMDALKNLTPSYIWSITNYMFVIGLIFCIFGLILFASFFLKERKVD